MATTVDQAYSDLAGVYDPQTTLLNQQSAQADTDAVAQMSALDQAKVNAFKSIDNSANAKGMLFSGFSPDQQAQYVGTKYLPAVANLKSATLNTKNTLAAKISQLNAQRRQDALGTVAAQQKAEQDQAYKDAQLSLGYARLNSSNANAAASRALKSSTTKAPTANDVRTYYSQQLANATGKDHKVNPADWRTAYTDLVNVGMSPRQIWQAYGQYAKVGYAGYNVR